MLPSTMLDPALLETTRIRPLRRSEYDRLVDLGMFEGERLELLRGVLVEMSPQKASHAVAVQRLTHLFVARLGTRALVRIQLPLALSDDSEPEPDVAIVPLADYARAHPSSALLLVEVADDSRAKDRKLKAALYAEAGIAEYWIVDVVDAVIEVRTEPEGGVYRRVERLERDARLAPRAFPDVVLSVVDIVG